MVDAGEMIFSLWRIYGNPMKGKKVKLSLSTANGGE